MSDSTYREVFAAAALDDLPGGGEPAAPEPEPEALTDEGKLAAAREMFQPLLAEAEGQSPDDRLLLATALREAADKIAAGTGYGLPGKAGGAVS
jgi:hypothetical protein